MEMRYGRATAVRLLTMAVLRRARGSRAAASGVGAEKTPVKELAKAKMETNEVRMMN